MIRDVFVIVTDTPIRLWFLCFTVGWIVGQWLGWWAHG